MRVYCALTATRGIQFLQLLTKSGKKSLLKSNKCPSALDIHLYDSRKFIAVFSKSRPSGSILSQLNPSNTFPYVHATQHFSPPLCLDLPHVLSPSVVYKEDSCVSLFR